MAEMARDDRDGGVYRVVRGQIRRWVLAPREADRLRLSHIDSFPYQERKKREREKTKCM